MTRGGCEGIMGKKGGALTIIKDIWTITRCGWKQGREVGRVRVVERGGKKRQKTVFEQQ